MKVQEVRCVMVSYKDGEILLPKMRIARLATVKCEEKRKIRVVGIEQVERTQVEDVIARYCREKCVEEIVFFFVDLGVMDAEDFVEICTCAVHLRQIEVVNYNGQRKVAVVIVHTQMPTMAFDGGFGQVVVEKGVVFEFGKFELVGMKVESLLENAEDFLFV